MKKECEAPGCRNPVPPTSRKYCGFKCQRVMANIKTMQSRLPKDAPRAPKIDQQEATKWLRRPWCSPQRVSFCYPDNFLAEQAGACLD